MSERLRLGRMARGAFMALGMFAVLSHSDAVALDQYLQDDACPTPSCNSANTVTANGQNTNTEDDRYSGPIKGVAQPLDNTQPANTSSTASVDLGGQGITSAAGIPMPSTPAMSIAQYWPWAFLEDTGAAAALYTDSAGTTVRLLNTPLANGTAQSDADNAATAALNSFKCKPITLTSSNSSSSDNSSGSSGGSSPPPNPELLERLQLDSCANQFVLTSALDPSTMFDQHYRNDQMPWNETWCQPLFMTPVPCLQFDGTCEKDSAGNTMYDYDATGYLWLAWNNVLNSNYSPNGGGNKGDKGSPPVITSSGGISSLNMAQSGDGNFAKPNDLAFPGGTGMNGSQVSDRGKHLTLNDLSQFPYERIYDPTHPFSPRWDFANADRDLSDNARLTGSKVDGVGYDPSTSACIVRCAAVPVDILSFRAAEFTACMMCRVTENRICFWGQVDSLIAGYISTFYPYPYKTVDPIDAYNDTLNDTLPPDYPNYPMGLPETTCKTFYSLQHLWPVCSTKYDHPTDNVPTLCSRCVTLSGDTNPQGGVTKCCDDLAQAVVPINTLKLRNAQLDSTLMPVPEGYGFKEYFGNHMPYMRWWDTGKAAGAGNDPARNYDPNCDVGQYDVLVGVGVPGHSCKLGGNGATGSYAGITLANPDALTSWTELKQYQMTTQRNFGLNCIGQYPKLYMPGSKEAAVAWMAGGEIVKAWPEPQTASAGQSATNQTSGNSGSSPNGFEMTIAPWPLTFRGWLMATNPTEVFPCYGAKSGCDSKGNYTGEAGYTGLDNAQPGDIIYLTINDVASPTNGAASTTSRSNSPTNGTNTAIVPFAAYVTGVSHSASSGNSSTDTSGGDYIQVVDVSDGKHPDVCGNTDDPSFGSTRTIYKSTLPTSVTSAFYPPGTQTGTDTGSQSTTETGNATQTINSAGNCNNSHLSQCTFGADMWGKIHVYRPCADVRDDSGGTSNKCVPPPTSR